MDLYDKRGGKRRLGKKVFHLRKDIWYECKKYGVTDVDLQREYIKYRKIGIEVNWGTAAISAIRNKKIRFMRGGIL